MCLVDFGRGGIMWIVDLDWKGTAGSVGQPQSKMLVVGMNLWQLSP